MNWALIIANIMAAAALFFLGNAAVAAHKTHAYSVYVELKQRNLLNERPDYDIEKRLSTIADGGGYSLLLAEAGSGICIVNAFAIFFLFNRPNPNTHKTSN